MGFIRVLQGFIGTLCHETGKTNGTMATTLATITARRVAVGATGLL